MKSGKTSKRRQDASRRNGALSKGPITPEGKARSSRNAITHGCLAIDITFNDDEAQLFERIRDGYIARFEPRDQVEHDIVEEIVFAKWQMRQAWQYEKSLVTLKVVDDAELIDSTWDEISKMCRRSLAYSATFNDNKVVANLQRYARSLAFQVERSIKMLMELKALPLPPLSGPGDEPVEIAERNEPIPISGHPAPSAPAAPEPEPESAPIGASAAFAPACASQVHQPSVVKVLDVPLYVGASLRSGPIYRAS